MSTLLKLAVIGSVVATSVALVPVGPASAAATVPCFDGYVCVQLEKGKIIAVPEGQSETFPAGTTMIGISNQTKISYCVGGSPSFGIASGVEIVRTQAIKGFEPGNICLS